MRIPAKTKMILLEWLLLLLLSRSEWHQRYHRFRYHQNYYPRQAPTEPTVEEVSQKVVRGALRLQKLQPLTWFFPWLLQQLEVRRIHDCTADEKEVLEQEVQPCSKHQVEMPLTTVDQDELLSLWLRLREGRRAEGRGKEEEKKNKTKFKKKKKKPESVIVIARSKTQSNQVQVFFFLPL